jgi:4-amino-4-deoxy-L-arabinose transferase-like glycosyltransferase
MLPAGFVAYYGGYSAVDGAKAIILCGVLAAGVAWLLTHVKDAGGFLTRLFVAALLFRVAMAALIFVTNTQEFFGGDAYTYDTLGMSLLKSWEGSLYDAGLVLRFVGKGYSGSGWGMIYLVGGIYSLIGRNMFAVQLVNAVAGAASAPIIYLIAQQLFGHRNVSRIAALSVAFFPSLALWSSQGLKDGPIIFLLALSMLATLRLGEKFDVKYFVILAAALFGLLSLRFYVFYMAVAAIGLAFVIGTRSISAQSLVRQLLIVAGLGVVFAYLGISQFASVQLEQYGSLAKIQRSREDLASSADSGFGKDADVSTTEGALTVVPVGLTYLLLAPFPWQMASLRSMITLPEMLVWWFSIPLLVSGVVYGVKYRLRKVFPILIFIAMLTLAYSVVQGNVGTAYRQRSQLLIFYLIFAAVGYCLAKEKREDKRLSRSK